MTLRSGRQICSPEGKETCTMQNPPRNNTEPPTNNYKNEEHDNMPTFNDSTLVNVISTIVQCKN